MILSSESLRRRPTDQLDPSPTPRLDVSYTTAGDMTARGLATRYDRRPDNYLAAIRFWIANL